MEKFIRINKFLADAGIASRRAVDQMIQDGRVSINGQRAQAGQKISSDDQISLDGANIHSKEKKYITILLNKPDDCITTTHDERGRKTVLQYVRISERVYPIGRLDRHTTGVLLLTNDGDLANKLMHPRFSVEKTYHAYLDKPLTETHMKKLESGIMLDEKKTAPANLKIHNQSRRDIFITIHEGMNRQVHRMFESLRYTVLKLDRIAYAGMTAGTLKRGEWRYATPQELKKLSTNR